MNLSKLNNLSSGIYFLDFMRLVLVPRIPVPFSYDAEWLLTMKVLLAPAGTYFLSSIWSLPRERVLDESLREELSFNLVGLPSH